MVFFVLSGYALSVGHLNENARKLPQAAAARYFRLMIPILATSLIAYILLKLNVFYNLAAAVTKESSSDWLGTFYTFEADLVNVLRFSFFDVFFQYNNVTTYNSSLWTMPVEILGSFLIYAFLGIFRASERIYWRLIVLGILILLIYKPLIACFFSGYLIAEIDRRREVGEYKYLKFREYASLVGFLMSAVLSTYFRSDDRVGFLFASTIVFAAISSGRLKVFFSSGFSEFLGKISFPLFLIQIPIICSWSSFLYIKLPELGFSRIEANYINIVSTIVFCIISSVLLLPIEKISIRYSKIIGKYLARS